MSCSRLSSTRSTRRPTQVADQGVERVGVGGLGQAERGGDPRHDERRLAHRREVDGHARRRGRPAPRGQHLEREPGLADPAGAGDRHQPVCPSVDERAQPLELGVAADERRRRARSGAVDAGWSPAWVPRPAATGGVPGRLVVAALGRPGKGSVERGAARRHPGWGRRRPERTARRRRGRGRRRGSGRCAGRGGDARRARGRRSPWRSGRPARPAPPGSATATRAGGAARRRSRPAPHPNPRVRR